MIMYGYVAAMMSMSHSEQIKSPPPPKPTEIVHQPWGDEYACCGGPAGSDQHVGSCGA